MYGKLSFKNAETPAPQAPFPRIIIRNTICVQNRTIGPTPGESRAEEPVAAAVWQVRG